MVTVPIHLVDVPAVTPVIQLRPLASIIAERREPKWLLHNVIERNVLALLVGPRGTFKSFIALEWAMRVAMNDEPVLILSGEGAGLGIRAEAWLKAHVSTDPSGVFPVLALERPLALSVAAELEALADTIAAMPRPPVLIVVDTFSKYSAGLDENSNADVANYLLALSRALRERFGATVLLVGHTGHMDAKRMRGAYTLGANTDAEYIVLRDPRSMTVSLSRERFKDTPSLPPLAYEARIIDLGRADAYGAPVTSLALYSTEASPVVPQKRGRSGTGKHQQAVLVALREWARANPDAVAVSSDVMTGLLKAQGIDRQRKAELLNWFCNAQILMPSVGGHTINREAL